MVRLDHNRAMSQLAEKTGTHNTDIKNIVIWGNHSATQYPDIHHATVKGEAAKPMVDDHAWWTPAPSSRMCSSAARPSSRPAVLPLPLRLPRPPSTTCAAGPWGTPEGEWVSMGIPSDGSYGIEPGVIYGYPCTCKDGKYEIVQGLDINEFSRAKMDATDAELREERAAVEHLFS
jgi:malate dehydrogenase